MLPSDKIEKKKADKIAMEAARTEQSEHLRTIMNGAFGTPDGKAVLKWLKDQCGYGRPIQILDDRTMALGVMRHNLYAEIRKHINKQTLMEIEHD